MYDRWKEKRVSFLISGNLFISNKKYIFCSERILSFSTDGTNDLFMVYLYFLTTLEIYSLDQFYFSILYNLIYLSYMYISSNIIKYSRV